MNRKVVLAYSGGLDTNYCILWLREQGWAVHTVTVHTGGFKPNELAEIESRARAAGVADHRTIDSRRELFDDYIRYLIFANALRGDVYPLCVSVERVAQARRCALYAKEIGADALAHGSTGAGNDQVRFDVAFRVYAPGIAILTPIRDQSLSREEETAYLERHGIRIPPKTTRYSVNQGLWGGATIGGSETHGSDGVLPEEAYILTSSAAGRPSDPADISVRFEKGVPTAIDGRSLDPVSLIETLNERAGRYGVGRGMHVGDTILGIKGRVAFERAAAVLLPAHRELEKLTLSRQQLMWKRTLGDLYGSMLHEARFFDPLMRDIEAFLSSSQARVSGDVNVRLSSGQATVLGATSPFSLLGISGTRYGEGSGLWTAAEAAAFSKLYGIQEYLLASLETGGNADATSTR